MPAYNPGGWEGTSDDVYSGEGFSFNAEPTEGRGDPTSWGDAFASATDTAVKGIGAYANLQTVLSRNKAQPASDTSPTFVTADGSPGAQNPFSFGGVDLTYILVIGGALFLVARILD